MWEVNKSMYKVAVTGAFDDLRSGHIRFLQEASRLGELHILLWSDDAVRVLTGKAPKFSQAERLYLLGAIRYVAGVHLVMDNVEPDRLPQVDGFSPEVWVVPHREDNSLKRNSCCVKYRVISSVALAGFPVGTLSGPSQPEGTRKVVVTGCFDWFHSGHVRFFEEAAGLGDLYVVVGSDANLHLLKGAGHPLLPQDERRYMVQSVRYVHQALISSGSGWMDAEPEIAAIRPDVYVVNEDGDNPEKRGFCFEHGIEYQVLKRVPAAGLPRRQSTDLRGF